MKADDFLAKLSKSRKTGPANWIACCPAHADKNPSMTIRELDDGRVLVHCFAGCSVDDILAAVGLTFEALFPDHRAVETPAWRRPFPAADVLEAIKEELGVIAIITGDIEEKRAVSESDMARLRLARKRVEHAVMVANGKR